VRLRAIMMNGKPRLRVTLAGDAASAAPLGSIPVEAAAHVVLAVLRIIVARGRMRAADVLRTEGLAAFADIDHIQPDAVPSPPRPAAELIGLHPLRDGEVALGVALAFGHAHADALAALANAAAARTARAVRPAPGRGLLLIGLTEPNARALADDAARLALIVRADDPRRRIVACPGKPACASGLIAARALAGEIARLAALPGKGTAVHVSGCSKGCAHASPAALTIVGTERGCGIVHRGSARATPRTYVDPDNLAAEVARLAPQISEFADA
jgi:precorrin-3B synthase